MKAKNELSIWQKADILKMRDELDIICKKYYIKAPIIRLQPQNMSPNGSLKIAKSKSGVITLMWDDDK